jgi:hypothetical protein
MAGIDQSGYAMADLIIAQTTAVTAGQFEGGDDGSAYRREQLAAMCRGIIANIVADLKAVGTDTHGDGHNLDLV